MKSIKVGVIRTVSRRYVVQSLVPIHQYHARRFASLMIFLAVFLLASTSACECEAAKPFRKVLTSADKNVCVKKWKTTSKQVTPNCSVNWSIKKVQLVGGKQDGVDLIVVDNGKLKFTVIPTRGMGVLSARMGDVLLGWNSPVKEVVHPKYINLQSRGGLGWLEGFNEWMCRCGLESNGHPGTDKFINNVGDEATMELTLHGKIANIPASKVEIVVDCEPPYRIRIRGRVDEKMFYGPKLELQTEISTVPGSNTFRISDVITNRGAQPQEFEILYHSNYGRPLLEEGATFVAPVKRVTPFNEKAAKGIDGYHIYRGPTPGFIEQVYCFRLYGDQENRTLILLHNKAGNRAVSMSWSLDELPYLTVWKNTAAEKDGYVTGIEPGTNFPYNRRVERKFGRVPKLEAGASHRASIDFTIHVGGDEIRTAAKRIQAISKGRSVIVDRSPPDVDEE